MEIWYVLLHPAPGKERVVASNPLSGGAFGYLFLVFGNLSGTKINYFFQH
jgi:hypothetical protein